ncbi:MAG: hypothetical protein J3Q66DRAFT_439541 [Benniella sp.]|nr:MAG: hypothetical protein J3Q66DRAFT_439541 [Benniella sp.]
MDKGYTTSPQPGTYQDRPNKLNNTSATTCRTLIRAGLLGLMIALSLKLMWMSAELVLLQKIIPSVEETVDHPDKTTLPIRPFTDDETFLVMDDSPWLGFNNMRYMIERALYLADLLNRTLVLPNHLRIRRCSDETIYARTAIPLDLGRNEQGSTIALDLGYFFDLPICPTDLRTLMEEVVGVPRGDESRLNVRRSLYVFSDVRGGGLEKIVEWSLFFKRDQYVPELDLGSCRPPSEDSNVENIPWEARFHALATCRIEHYIGLK